VLAAIEGPRAEPPLVADRAPFSSAPTSTMRLTCPSGGGDATTIPYTREQRRCPGCAMELVERDGRESPGAAPG